MLLVVLFIPLSTCTTCIVYILVCAHKCITLLVRALLNIYYLYLRSEMVNVPTWESILLLVLRFQYAVQAVGCAHVQVSINEVRRGGKGEERGVRRRMKWNVRTKKSNRALIRARRIQHFNTASCDCRQLRFWNDFLWLDAVSFEICYLLPTWCAHGQYLLGMDLRTGHGPMADAPCALAIIANQLNVQNRSATRPRGCCVHFTSCPRV